MANLVKGLEALGYRWAYRVIDLPGEATNIPHHVARRNTISGFHAPQIRARSHALILVLHTKFFSFVFKEYDLTSKCFFRLRLNFFCSTPHVRLRTGHPWGEDLDFLSAAAASSWWPVSTEIPAMSSSRRTADAAADSARKVRVVGSRRRSVPSLSNSSILYIYFSALFFVVYFSSPHSPSSSPTLRLYVCVCVCACVHESPCHVLSTRNPHSHTFPTPLPPRFMHAVLQAARASATRASAPTPSRLSPPRWRRAWTCWRNVARQCYTRLPPCRPATSAASAWCARI